MDRPGRLRAWLRELALGAVVVFVLVAARTWLPTDGWGLYVRWALTVLLALSLLLWVAYAVQEFRRGYAGEE